MNSFNLLKRYTCASRLKGEKAPRRAGCPSATGATRRYCVGCDPRVALIGGTRSPRHRGGGADRPLPARLAGSLCHRGPLSERECVVDHHHDRRHHGDRITSSSCRRSEWTRPLSIRSGCAVNPTGPRISLMTTWTRRPERACSRYFWTR